MKSITDIKHALYINLESRPDRNQLIYNSQTFSKQQDKNSRERE